MQNRLQVPGNHGDCPIQTGTMDTRKSGAAMKNGMVKKDIVHVGKEDAPLFASSAVSTQTKPEGHR